MKITVAKGRALRDPVNRQLLMKEGDEREVPASVYWLRRVRAGDVVKSDDAPPPQPHGHRAAHAPAKE